MRWKLDFFNADKVIRAMDRATRQALSKAGSFIRQRARNSLKVRKKSSEPGKPPHSHKGGGHLRRYLFFSADLEAKNVIVGPATWGRGEAPALLEYGGSVIRQRVNIGRRHQASVPFRRYTYRARPFMGPALEAELPNIPDLWRHSVVAGGV